MDLFYYFMIWLNLLLVPCAFAYVFFRLLTSHPRFRYLRSRWLTITGWLAWAIAMFQFTPYLLLAVNEPSVIFTPDWLWLLFSLSGMLILLLANRHLRLGWGMLLLTLLILLSPQQYILQNWILPLFYRDALPSYWTPRDFDWLSTGLYSVLIVLIVLAIGYRRKTEEQ